MKPWTAILSGVAAVIFSLTQAPGVWARPTPTATKRPTATPTPTFHALGGIIMNNPSCADTSDGTGDVACAAKATNNSLVGIRFNFKTNFNSGLRSKLRQCAVKIW